MSSLAEVIVKKNKDKVPIGTLLLVDELILLEDLEFALDHQKQSKQRLGEILVLIGALNGEDLERTLQLQSSCHAH